MACPPTNSGKPEKNVPQEPTVTEGLDNTGEEARGEAVEWQVFTSTDGPMW